MTTILDEFFVSYLHYSVAQRLFEDTCRQLTQCKGTVDERQALVDETLRLATCVSDNIDDTESLIADTIEYLQSEGGDPDILDAMSYITNNLKEDRARADNYSLFVTARRTGNTTRRPRKPQVANPFVYVPDDEPQEDTGLEEPDPKVTEEDVAESVEEEAGEVTGTETETESEEPRESSEEQSEEEGAAEEESDTDETDPEPKKKKKIFGRRK
jgi:hypothetical protein